MKIVVAMSGGVDSSVAAALLVEQGHEVIGVSMQLYDHSGNAGRADGERTFGSCCTLEDLYDARRVAAAIDIPHYILNFERQFDEQVVSNFVREYSSGRTPLPCAHCNSDPKFATLVERARGFGAEWVATGHYARVEHDPSTHIHLLKRGVDAAKDQSYFLFSLTQAQLARAVFPVGGMPKHLVRDYARLHRLPVAEKPDSQEICFIPNDDYASFVAAHAPETPTGGLIVDEQGHVVGSHRGDPSVHGGPAKGPRHCLLVAVVHVVALRPVESQVVVGPRSSLERTALTASGVNWVTGEPSAPLNVRAQIRHRHQPAAGVVRSLGENRAELVFEIPQPAVTPGQAVVFYDDDVVVGGGWID